MTDRPEVDIVIPVYNEESNLPGLIRDWRHLFEEIAVRYRFLFIDDGSADGSLSLLQSFQKEASDILIHSQANAGHGPAILTGYRIALQTEWVFQVDSDHHFKPETFRTLWANRKDYDLLLGERNEKNATLARQELSRLSTLIVRLMFGKGVKDVNSPYRLIRTTSLQQALQKIPSESFAPNVLLTSWFIANKSAIFITPLQPRNDPASRKSQLNNYFLKGSLKAFLQTIIFRFRL